MTSRQSDMLPTLIVILVGTAWGVYWVPVRMMDDAGMSGAWGTFAVVMAAVLCLAPFAISKLRFNKETLITALAVFTGGAGFVMYSVGFVYGRVAIIVLLFFLTPVWSTLIARYIMGWETPRLRLYAIGVGLAGLFIMLSADGSAPLPQNIGEWMALVSGILWSISSTAMRARPPLNPVVSAFAFAIGAAFCAGLMAPFLSTFPGEALRENAWQVAGLALVTGCLFWSLSMVGILWAVPKLDPARVGILLMAEVLIGTATAAYFAGEAVSVFEVVGGLLVLAAGVLEVWPVKAPAKTV